MVLAGEGHECVLQGEISGDPLEHSIRQNASLSTVPESGKCAVGFRLRPGFKCNYSPCLFYLLK